jgi:hypothetical protein
MIIPLGDCQVEIDTDLVYSIQEGEHLGYLFKQFDYMDVDGSNVIDTNVTFKALISCLESKFINDYTYFIKFDMYTTSITIDQLIIYPKTGELPSPDVWTSTGTLEQIYLTNTNLKDGFVFLPLDVDINDLFVLPSDAVVGDIIVDYPNIVELFDISDEYSVLTNYWEYYSDDVNAITTYTTILQYENDEFKININYIYNGTVDFELKNFYGFINHTLHYKVNEFGFISLNTSGNAFYTVESLDGNTLYGSYEQEKFFGLTLNYDSNGDRGKTWFDFYMYWVIIGIMTILIGGFFILRSVMIKKCVSENQSNFLCRDPSKYRKEKYLEESERKIKEELEKSIGI